MVLCIGTTPAAQRVMVFRRLVVDAVNRAATTLDGAAGKSVNVAKVLQVLGERPVATGFLGGDRGEFVRSVLEARGIELDFVTVAARTRQCVTVIDEAASAHTELVEESRAVEPSDFEKLLTICGRRVPGCRAVVMSGTITPFGPGELYEQCTRLANAVGALSVVDAHGGPLLAALAAGPGLVKTNRAELPPIKGRDLKDDAAVMTNMRRLCEHGARRVVVTAGNEPTLAFDGRTFWRITTPRVLAKNPIGSGDAFTAGLVWRLLRGDRFGEACRWASATGAANAVTLMAGEVEKAEVERLVREVNVEKI